MIKTCSSQKILIVNKLRTYVSDGIHTFVAEPQQDVKSKHVLYNSVAIIIHIVNLQLYC